MATNKLVGKVFVSGLLLGAAVIGGAWWMLKDPVAAPVAQTPARMAPAAQSAAPAKAALAACPSQPAAPVAGKKDGQYVLPANLSDMTVANIASFIIVGKEAAAAGRPRDAEVAFLMSCRVADTLKGRDSAEAADAKYQLGWLYSRIALEGGSSAGAAGANRPEMLKRAELMYSDSVQGYRARYGEGHEKSRFAAEGLASIQQALTRTQPGQSPQAAQTQTPQIEQTPRLIQTPQVTQTPLITQPTPAAQQPSQRNAASPAEPARPAGGGAAGGSGGNSTNAGNARPAEAPLAAPPQARKVEVARVAPIAPITPPSPQEANPATRLQPSFDCGKARSAAEKMICSDAELARLDRELGRVYARAKNVTVDAAAFKRQNNEEWRRRESTCRDRDCLLRWYAQRHDQLMDDIDEGQDQRRPPPPPPASQPPWRVYR